MQIPQLRLIKQLTMGFSHSMAVGNFGSTFTWGTDENGSLGQGMKWPRPGSRVPVAIPVNLESGACGWKHTAGVGKEGQLHCWGWGGAVGSAGLMGGGYDLGAGQLGLGDDMDYHEPRQVQRLLLSSRRNAYRDLRQTVGSAGKGWRAVQVSCGRNHTAAVIEAEVSPAELD